MNILLVDDESEIVHELTGFLRRRGHGVAGADCVAAALHALDHEGPFDVVLTDMRMPDGSGLDVVRACRKGGQPQPSTLVMSGHAGPADIAEAHSEGALHFLAKPISLRALRDLLAGLTANPVESG